MRKSIELQAGWLLAIDPDNTGKASGFALAPPASARPAPVPGIIQQVYPAYHGVAWYYFRMTPDSFVPPQEQERLFLRFGAVDYYSEIFVDGRLLHTNEGAENEFQIDVTDVLTPDSLLAVRVINPKKGEPIDGFELDTVPHRNKVDGGFAPGASYNSGGIMLPVTLAALSAVRVSDCFVRAGWETGIADLEITIQNDTAAAVKLLLNAAIRPAESPVSAVEQTAACTAPVGGSVFRMAVEVPAHKLWDIDSPNLYELTLTAESAATLPASYATHFGFRDFRLKEGYFYLNGRRIFLKSAHTGNHMPEGLSLPAPSMPGLEYRDFQLSKAAGFNCIRFISTQATPRQLDYCDRLGLMVYQETFASWLLGDSEQAERRYRESIAAELRRDRNHPCLTIWGALNETMISDAYYAARDALPLIRSLDDTRLCIFSSGRFDQEYPSDRAKPDFGVGCAANPGSEVWEPVWGDDGNGDDSQPRVIGDYHFYPAYPLTPEAFRRLRTYGAGTKPCLLSEYGVGSHLNVIDLCLEYERWGTDPDAPDYRLIRSIRDRYLRDFERYGLSGTYADPADHLRDSEKYNALSRRDGFDVIRANHKFAGYNLTGLLDHAICGEGPYTFFRRVKPGNFDALQDGWSPLRWCLFCSAGHIYSGEPLRLEAVLADEDVLADGSYRARFAITDETGTPHWRTEVEFTLPVCDETGLRRLAYPVYEGEVALPLPPGKYSFRAYLQNGGSAAASEKEFYVSDRAEAPAGQTVAVVGLPEPAAAFLAAQGIAVTERWEDPAVSVILAGSVDAETGRKLLERTAAGVRTVFLDPDALLSEKGAGEFLPLPEYRCEFEPNWLYHKEGVILRHPFFAGMKTGFLDWNYYAGACPVIGIQTAAEAESCASVNFYVGGPGEYRSSVNLAVYRHGEGELILNTFPILSSLGSSPAGDRLLLNLIGRQA